MRKIKLAKFLSGIAIFIISGLSVYSQVGINTQSPTSALDINGDLRIRQTVMSSSPEDYVLVVDTTGLVKKSVIENASFKGYLSQDFTSGTTAGVYKITNFSIIDEINCKFDQSTNLYTCPASGLYNIVMTVTLTCIQDISSVNTVCGFVNNATNKWVMRFSIPLAYIKPLGNNSTAGVTCSFSGAVFLNKGDQFYFGMSDSMKILSNPTGSSGQGLGTYFSLEFIKRTLTPPA